MMDGAREAEAAAAGQGRRVESTEEERTRRRRRRRRRRRANERRWRDERTANERTNERGGRKRVDASWVGGVQSGRFRVSAVRSSAPAASNALVIAALSAVDISSALNANRGNAATAAAYSLNFSTSPAGIQTLSAASAKAPSMTLETLSFTTRLTSATDSAEMNALSASGLPRNVRQPRSNSVAVFAGAAPPEPRRVDFFSRSSAAAAAAFASMSSFVTGVFVFGDDAFGFGFGDSVASSAFFSLFVSFVVVSAAAAAVAVAAANFDALSSASDFIAAAFSVISSTSALALAAAASASTPLCPGNAFTTCAYSSHASR
eukprot:31022-Pelagococcus_subviridis.AAC.3